MGVDVPESLVLLQQVAEQLHEDEMLQYIRVIAGVKSVSVAEHPAMVKQVCRGAASGTGRQMKGGASTAPAVEGPGCYRIG
jgi:hypothetical protein